MTVTFLFTDMVENVPFLNSKHNEISLNPPLFLALERLDPRVVSEEVLD